MTVGTTDFVDATVRAPARSTTRDTADAAAARARFSRDLDAANQAAAAAKDAARSRNSAERARSDDAVSAGQADRAKAAAAADANAAKAASSRSDASATAAPAARDGRAAPSDSAAPRSETAASARNAGQARDAGPARAGTGATANDASANAAAAATASDGKSGSAKAFASEAEAGKAADPKAGDAALATPTIALLLGTPIPTLPRGSVAVPVAGAGSVLDSSSARTEIGAPANDASVASENAAASATVSDGKSGSAKAPASEAEAGKAADPKAGDAARATPTIALVLGAPLPALPGGSSAVPAAGAGSVPDASSARTGTGVPAKDVSENAAAAATASGAKSGSAKAPASEAEAGKAADPKAGDAARATPTIALVLGAPLPALPGGSAAVPVAGAGEATAAGIGAVGTAAAGTPADTGLVGIAGRPALVEDATGDDAATGTDPGSGAVAKADLLAALTDGAPAALATPDLAAKTQAAPSGVAPVLAEKAATASAPPVPLGQVPMTIGLRSLAGSSEFQIRLDPLELGRVDVKLDIDKDSGTVTTHLVVERVETLAMLQRDAGNLQQALTQAGLDPSQGGITMSLASDGGAGGETARRDEQFSRGSALPGTPSEAAVAEVVPLRALRSMSGIDIRI